MSEEQTSFKVTDRRLFNADGSPRELSPEEKQEAAAAKAASDTTSAARPDSTTATQAASQETSTRGAESRAASSVKEEVQHEADDADLDDTRDPASFVNFLMSIASNAASSLGMMEHPVTHQREVDLELGKHWIDVLGMLQQKTRGNLSAQENQILEGLLSDLRMQYVSLANSKQAKAAPSYTGRDILGGK
jgi:Domain of unknown function (DUF1844)